MQILHCVDRYLASRAGGVKKLQPPRTGFRLSCGDYRVFFDQKAALRELETYTTLWGHSLSRDQKYVALWQECLRHGLASSL
jgi:hypothetical protein